MIINHNLPGMNAIRNMNANSTAASKSMQKLSSGLRINSAADDAAGLAISEKMRGQIRGLDQASSNAQDGISMIQTAEGALGETTSILQRMRELAVQSSTDTNTADDRAKIQGETDQLAKEITRISNTTEFNTQNLLAGGLNDTFQIGANQGQNINLTVNAMDAKSLGVASDANKVGLFTDGGTATNFTSASVGDTDLGKGLVAGTYTATVTHTNAGESITSDTTNGVTLGGSYTGARDANVIFKMTGVTGADVTAAQYSTDGGNTWSAATVTANNEITYNGATITLGTPDASNLNKTATVAFTAQYDSIQLSNGGTNIGTAAKVYSDQTSVTVGKASTGETMTIHNSGTGVLGELANGSSFTQVVSTNNSTAAVINPDGTIVSDAVTQGGIDVSTQASANSAIKTIDTAINTVSQERAKLGAYSNRLDHTIANLGTSSENLTSSESRIRDVDMAKEMATFSKNNILAQAAQAMLAQANQQPQQVLQLLR